MVLSLEELHGGEAAEVGVAEVDGGNDGEVGVLRRGHASRPDHELVMMYGSERMAHLQAFLTLTDSAAAAAGGVDADEAHGADLGVRVRGEGDERESTTRARE